MRVLVTGAAGFIGAALARRLLARGDEVLGVDNLNDYYDVTLKQARLKTLHDSARFTFVKLDVADRDGLAELFERYAVDGRLAFTYQARLYLGQPRA